MGLGERVNIKVKDSDGMFTKAECYCHEEILDCQEKITNLVGHLISAGWDSAHLKKDIENERKHYHFLLDQLDFAEGERVEIREDVEK